MAYGNRGGGGGRGRGGGKPNFQDSGFISKNDYKEKDSHPSHKGKITLSPQLLQFLNDKYENGEELNLDLAGWRKDDNPSMIKLKVSEPYVKEDEDDRPRRSSGGSGRNAQSSRRREDEDDDRPDRRVRARGEDEHDRSWKKPAGTRGQLTDDMDDDFPGDRKTTRRRNDDYGDERDL